MKMNDIIEKRKNGATYQEIADAEGVSKQWVQQLITKHAPELKGARGSARRRALDQVNRLQAENERYKGVIKLLENDVHTAKNEAVKEFAEKITEIFMRYAHLHNYADQARVAEVESADGTKIELFSVWDVLTLKKHGMAEYEEMGELQHNIEYIANDKLLTEIEKDFRLLVKEMTEQSTGYGSSKTEGNQ